MSEAAGQNRSHPAQEANTNAGDASRLKVLLSSSTFPTSLDGKIPRFIFDLAHALNAHADICVLAPHAPGAARSEKLEGVSVLRFSYFLPTRLQRLALDQGMRDNLRSSWFARAQVPLYMAALTRTTRRLVRTGNYDVLNPHWLLPQGLATATALLGANHPPMVLTVHGGDVYLSKQLPGGRHLARFVVRRSSAVFSSGSEVRSTLDDLLGYPSGAILRPMGVRYGLFGTTKTEIAAVERFPGGILLFVGRMIEVKGVEYLVRAFSSVREKLPGIGLVLIGDGPEEAKIRALVGNLGLENAVVFLGRKPHEEIIRYLQAALVFVVPSIIDSRGGTEGMPTVVVEAMAAGVRVVASRVGGIPDVIDSGVNGWLCRPADAADLSRTIIEAIESSDAQRIAERARSDARKHDWAAVAEEYMRVFRRVVTRN